MDVITAAQNVAEDYVGASGRGAVALAKDIDKNPTTLAHQLTETGSAVLGLRTAVKMTKRSRDLRILLAFAAECGQMCVPLPDALDVEGEDCMKRLSETSREFAELCQEVCADLSDGKISDNELARINRSIGELLAAVQALQTAATARNATTNALRVVA